MQFIDPKVKVLLADWAEKKSVPITELTSQMVRNEDKDVQKLQDSPEEVDKIDKLIALTKVGEIPINVYTPLQSNGKQLPVLIFFHGGGFVIGSESYESPIRAMANKSKCIICAVQYRLAPEHKFLTAVNGCLGSYRMGF